MQEGTSSVFEIAAVISAAGTRVSKPPPTPPAELRRCAFRGASNRAIYRGYKGIDARWARNNAHLCFYECIKPRLFAPALARMDELRRQDIPIVLVTGGLNFVLQPLADYLGAELIAPGLREKNGLFTGEMDHSPLTGSSKYVAVCKHATHHRIDLTAADILRILEKMGPPSQCTAVGV